MSWSWDHIPVLVNAAQGGQTLMVLVTKVGVSGAKGILDWVGEGSSIHWMVWAWRWPHSVRETEELSCQQQEVGEKWKMPLESEWRADGFNCQPYGDNRQEKFCSLDIYKIPEMPVTTFQSCLKVSVSGRSDFSLENCRWWWQHTPGIFLDNSQSALFWVLYFYESCLNFIIVRRSLLSETEVKRLSLKTWNGEEGRDWFANIYPIYNAALEGKKPEPWVERILADGTEQLPSSWS